jgi:hypothetical protein
MFSMGSLPVFARFRYASCSNVNVGRARSHHKSFFFFETKECPKTLGVGDRILLLGVQLQMWKGYLQLSGKNIHVENVTQNHP